MTDPDSTSLRGKLLIASPALMDPNFRRTVILVAEHGEEGAMGLVLNHESEATVGEAVPDLAQVTDADASIDVGGPVAGEGVVVLCDFEDPSDAGLVVFESIGLPAVDVDLGTLATEVRRTRVFAGHAGWGPGQLEAELEGESWVVENPLPEDVFPEDPGIDLWAALWRRKGGSYELLASMPFDPSLN